MNEINQIARRVVRKDPLLQNLRGKLWWLAVKEEEKRIWRAIYDAEPLLRKDRRQKRLIPPKRD
jgi:hypothetical protein